MERKHLLIKLGHAIFICNGNSFVGLQDLDANDLKEALTSCEVAEDDIRYILRLEFFEQKSVASQIKFQFFHRSVREFLVALFGSESSSNIPITPSQKRLSESCLSVYRCIMAQLQSSAEKRETKLTDKVITVSKHFLKSYQRASKWAVGQMICEIIQLGCHVSPHLFTLRDVLHTITRCLVRLKIPFDTKLINALNSNYLNTHLKIGKIDCKKCVLPILIHKKARGLVLSSDHQNEGYNWPQNKSFVLSPFLVKGEDIMVFCIPSGFFSSHISQQSDTSSIAPRGIYALQFFLSLDILTHTV